MSDSCTNKTILSIVPAPLMPAVSGGQKHTYGLLDALGKIAKVVCITDTESSPEGLTFKLLPLIPHNIKKYWAFGNYRLLLKQINKYNPSAILLEQPYMGIIVDLLSRKKNIPFFIHAHNVEFLRFKSLGTWWWPLMYLWERYAFSKAKAIFFISEVDMLLAQKHFNLPKANCVVSPYGVPQNNVIIAEENKIESVRARHGIAMTDTVFMFFGVLKYLPNIEALEIIINKLLPRLIERYEHSFKILICGGGISPAYKKQLEKTDPEHLIYAGFVNDIDEYTQSADVILNPILNGGGVKTKVMEALGFNKNVVSTKTGALGIDLSVCGEKLIVVDDNDWDQFTEQCINATKIHTTISSQFFENYSWQSIAQNLCKTLLKNN